MHKKLRILVGSTTGNAEYAAQAMELECNDQIAVEVLRMDGLGTEAFADRDALYIVCTSTYGAGDVPDNAQHLYAALDAEPRDLTHVRYGVFALGDSSFVNTFAGGGKRFDERLADLGAKRLGDVFVHDALQAETAEDVAAGWAGQWLKAALGAAQAAA